MVVTQILNQRGDFDFPLMKRWRFLVANGADKFRDSDIEMIPTHNLSYTSLKDILPVSSVASRRKESWREIPIKNPLVQHAAWAYLQPMMVLEEKERRLFVRKIVEKCRWLIGCFNDVVLVAVKSLFSEHQSKGTKRMRIKLT